jgi:hypothetical protein
MTVSLTERIRSGFARPNEPCQNNRHMAANHTCAYKFQIVVQGHCLKENHQENGARN